MARRATSTIGPLLAMVLSVQTPPLAANAVGQQGGRAQIYATVIDETKRPVLGLGSEDLVLRDGGVRQVSLGAEPAIDPLAIAIVTDGLEAADLPDLRRALDGVVRTIGAGSPASQVGLWKDDPSGAQVVMLSSDAAATNVANLALDTFAIPARRTIVDRISDACLALRSAPTDRLVVLAIVRRHTSEPALVDSYRLTDTLLRSKTALWTIELTPSAGASGPVKKNAVDDVLAAATQMGGSLREMVTSSAAIGPAGIHVASLLLSQYVVTYAWPDPMLSVVSITTRHDRGQVLTPVWPR